MSGLSVPRLLVSLLVRPMGVTAECFPSECNAVPPRNSALLLLHCVLPTPSPSPAYLATIVGDPLENGGRSNKIAGCAAVADTSTGARTSLPELRPNANNNASLPLTTVQSAVTRAQSALLVCFSSLSPVLLTSITSAGALAGWVATPARPAKASGRVQREKRSDHERVVKCRERRHQNITSGGNHWSRAA